MIQLQIMLLACTLLGEGTCRNVEISMEPNTPLTPYHCQFSGMIEIEKWISEHPGYYPKRWTCSRPTKET